MLACACSCNRDGLRYEEAPDGAPSTDAKDAAVPPRNAARPRGDAQAPDSRRGIYLLSTGTILRIEPDGSGERTVATKLGSTTAFSFDAAGDWIYFTAYPDPDQVQRIHLDGSGRQTLFGGPRDNVLAIEVDPGAGLLFTGVYYTGLYRGTTDPGGSYALLVGRDRLAPGSGARKGIALDPLQRHVYFYSPQDGPCGACSGRRIWRADYEGKDLRPLVDTHGYDCLALDLGAGHIYYARGGAQETPPAWTWRANLDGTNAAELPHRFPVSESTTDCEKLRLDLVRKKIYWLAARGSRDLLFRANLDGSGQETVYDAGTRPLHDFWLLLD